MTDLRTHEALDQLVQAARAVAAAVKTDPHLPVGEVLDTVTLTVTAMHLMLVDGGLLTRIADHKRGGGAFPAQVKPGADAAVSVALKEQPSRPDGQIAGGFSHARMVTRLGATVPVSARRVAVTVPDPRRQVRLTKETTSCLRAVSRFTLTASPGRPAQTWSSIPTTDIPQDPSAVPRFSPTPPWRVLGSSACGTAEVQTAVSPGAVSEAPAGAARTCTPHHERTDPDGHHGTAPHPGPRPRLAAGGVQGTPRPARTVRGVPQGRGDRSLARGAGRPCCRPRRAGGSVRRGVTAVTAIINEPAACVARVTFRGVSCPLHPMVLLPPGSPHYCPDGGGHRVLASKDEPDLLGGAL